MQTSAEGNMDNPFKRRRTNLPPTPSEVRPMCGCGLSRTFPFCDGSQTISKSNRAGTLVKCGATAAPGPSVAKAKAS